MALSCLVFGCLDHRIFIPSLRETSPGEWARAVFRDPVARTDRERAVGLTVPSVPAGAQQIAGRRWVSKN